MSAGHAGCVSSIHARSAREALTRLMIAAMKAPHHPPERLVQWMIAANIDLVIHLEKRGEARLVTEVIEVDSHLEGDHIPVRPLWHLDGGQLVRVAGAVHGCSRTSARRASRTAGTATARWRHEHSVGRTDSARGWGVACSRRARTAGIQSAFGTTPGRTLTASETGWHRRDLPGRHHVAPGRPVRPSGCVAGGLVGFAALQVPVGAALGATGGALACPLWLRTRHTRRRPARQKAQSPRRSSACATRSAAA